MSALISQLEGHRAISLEEVLQAAELQTRVDRKYLLTPAQFSGLAETLGSRFRCLEIEGKRIHGYESVYFDTADLALFRAHRQGRRHRYKVRTRTYTDSDQCLVEVKMKGRRGATIKKRMDYRSELRCDLDPNARRFLAETLRGYSPLPVAPLHACLTTSYHRATFVDPDEGARLTVDVDLHFQGGRTRRNGPDRILLESKSTGSAAVDRALASNGIRPMSLSKYCVGLAMTRPELAVNRWNALLRKEFGWARASARM